MHDYYDGFHTESNDPLTVLAQYSAFIAQNANQKETLYCVVQTSRIDNSKLILVDRTKCKKYFWTKSGDYMWTGTKEKALSIVSKLKYNNARIEKI